MTVLTLSFSDGEEQHVNAKRSPVKSRKKTATRRGGDDGKIHCVEWVHFLKTVQVRVLTNMSLLPKAKKGQPPSVYSHIVLQGTINCSLLPHHCLVQKLHLHKTKVPAEDKIMHWVVCSSNINATSTVICVDSVCNSQFSTISSSCNRQSEWDP